jgi:hypothetical protein
MFATALAHHSFAMLDQSKSLTLHGSVRDFRWSNPHVFIQMLATDEHGVRRSTTSRGCTSPRSRTTFSTSIIQASRSHEQSHVIGWTGSASAFRDVDLKVAESAPDLFSTPEAGHSSTPVHRLGHLGNLGYVALQVVGFIRPAWIRTKPPARLALPVSRRFRMNSDPLAEGFSELSRLRSMARSILRSRTLGERGNGASRR